MKTCIVTNCELSVEGNTDRCASHNRQARNISKQRQKEAEKREQLTKFKPLDYRSDATLKVYTEAKARKRIKKVSDKRKILNAEYAILRVQFLKEHTECELKLQGCLKTATQVHHTASGWNKATNLNNVKTWKASCDHCNIFLHDKISAHEARQRGLKI